MIRRSIIALVCAVAQAAFARTISSPSIGNFHTLPSWSPTSVDAAHTPGWNIPTVVTNIVVTPDAIMRGWRVESSGYSPIELRNHFESTDPDYGTTVSGYSDDSGDEWVYFDSGDGKWYGGFHTFNIYSEPISGSPTDTRLEFAEGVSVAVATAILDPETNMVVDVEWQTPPPPLRVTADTYAAIFAAEEAWLERDWYLDATPGNPSAAVRYANYWEPENVITNFVLSPSRRFVHSNDYRACLSKLGGIGLHAIEGWFYDASGNEIWPRFSVLYASSLLGDTTPAFPSFGWCSPADAVATISSWDSGYHLGCCTRDPYLVQSDFGHSMNVYARTNTLAIAALTSDLFADTSALPRATIDPLPSILSNNFGHADFSLLANASRRLDWNRMAAYNQAIACLDRSYIYGDTWGGGDISSAHHGQGRVIKYGRVSPSVDASINWTNTVTQTSLEVITNSNFYSDAPQFFAVSPTSTRWGGIMSGTWGGTGNTIAVDAVSNAIQQLVTDYNLPDDPTGEDTVYDLYVNAYLNGSTVDCDITLYLYWSEGGSATSTFGASEQLETPTNDIPVYAYADCTYTYVASSLPYSITNASPIAPTAHAISSGRVREMEIASLWTCDIATNYYAEVSDGGGYQTYIYPASSLSPTSSVCRILDAAINADFLNRWRSFALNDASSAQAYMRNALLGVAKHDPALPEDYALPKATALANAKAAGATVRTLGQWELAVDTSSPDYLSGHVCISGGRVTGYYNATNRTVVATPYVGVSAILHPEFRASSGNIDERPGATVSGSQNSIYRIDWNFNALNLTEDE